ncbi:MAG: sodium/solute symporter [Deltaproteobacteria bacterium]|nr:sodium/solute symporter [Deltaproteobacteria bacterium]
MTTIDWIIIAVYMAGLIALSVFLGRGQEGEEDYYVGGRDLPWWAVGVSTMATQASVISFISIPAFVAAKPGGGLTWLQYELAVPLAMIFVMVVLVPFFRELKLVSVYEYLEMRFSRSVRLLLSATFLISRGLGTGVGVYATAVVLETVTGLPIWGLVLFVGIITIIYDTIGGMKAVVWSDVVQMIILILGVGISIWYAVDIAGGWAAIFESFPDDRWRALDPGTGIVSGKDVDMGQPLWAYLIGGFFLYASYYGVDQSQAQRELSAPTLADTKKSLVFNGLARFPMTCLYLLLGLAVGAAIAKSPALSAAISGGSVDKLIPTFVVDVLPGGIRAVIIAAMLAAAMSSLDSALNSLSAATMRDFLHKEGQTSAQLLRQSKITTVVWGIMITLAGLLFAAFAEKDSPVIEVINKVGAAFYGPILATFTAGVLSKKVTGRGVVFGLFVGLAANLVLFVGPQISDGFVVVHWMWWNAVGFVIAMVVAFLASGAPEAGKDEYVLTFENLTERERPWLKTYGILVAMFAAILLVGWLANQVAAG